MSEFTPEFISETRKWMKKATMIEKTIMYKMLDEIERLSKQEDVFIYQIKRVLNECNLWDNQTLFDDLYALLPKEHPFIREIMS